MATLGRLLGVQLGVLLGSTTLLLQRKPAAPHKEESNDISPSSKSPVEQDGPPHLAATRALTHAADVVVFSRPGCPFCEDAENALLAQGVAFSKIPHAPHHASLLEMTGSPAAPSIWVRGKFVGKRYADERSADS